MLVWTALVLASLAASLAALPAAAQTTWPNQREGDFVLKNYVFDSGETLPELKLHYTVLGTPHKNAAGEIDNAVVLLHGRGGPYSILAQGRFSAATLSKRHVMWASFWAERGCFALVVDSFGPRGLAAGFAAGPCLLKDTMQLAAFSNSHFALGHAAMAINEGLPRYLLDRLSRRYDLESMTVGVLGMAFKGGSDDIRSSLAYKLKRILAAAADAVYCTDPYVTVDGSLLPLEVVVAKSDLLIIAAPHPEYADLVTVKPVVDIWNIRGDGVRI